MTITPESVGVLLRSVDFGDRLRGVNQLRELDPAVAFAMIQPLVTDSHVRVRYAAVCQLATLGQVDPAVAQNLLRGRLTDAEADVQAAAADAIAALKLPGAFDDLERLYNSTSDWMIQMSIVAALGELGDRRCFELLAEVLASGQELLQTVAVGALGELGDERAIPLLIPFATHDDWQVRYRVAQALSQFSGPEVEATLALLRRDTVAQVVDATQRQFHE
jgi:HEAT repeat protein